MADLKSIFFSISIIFSCLTACGNSSGAGFQLKGTLEKHPNKWLYLEEIKETTVNKIDSAKTDSQGNFIFTKKVSKKDFYRLKLDQNNMVGIILDPGDEVVYLNNGISLQEIYTLEGTAEGALVLEIKDYKARISKYGDSLNAVLSAIPAESQQAALPGLQDAYENFMTNHHNNLMKLIDKHPDKLGILIAAELIDPEMNFSDYEKLANYLNRSYSYSAVARQIINRAAQLKRTAVGQVAPEIDLPNPDGKNIPLSSLRGKVVLIDFWASWCGPCRKENPNVVNVYNKYKDKGFEVYSVSLDKDKNSWKNAIKQDGLPWKSHVSDLGFWSSSVVSQYGFQGIPYTVLIDKDGKILSKGLRGEKLEERLSVLLK